MTNKDGIMPCCRTIISRNLWGLWISMGIHPVDPVGLAQDEMREWSENRDHNTFYGHYWLI